MTDSITNIVEEGIATGITLFSGEKGTAAVIPIEQEREVFIGMFVRLKEAGYTKDDITTSHRERLISACRPHHLRNKNSEKNKWDFFTKINLTLAMIAVFDSMYGPNAPSFEDQIRHCRAIFDDLMEYSESQKEKFETKNEENNGVENLEKTTEQSEYYEYDGKEEPNYEPIDKTKTGLAAPKRENPDISWMFK